MKNTETSLEHQLTISHKAEMMAYMKSHPQDMAELIQLAIADKQPYSWRASWVLWSCMNNDDKRVRKYRKKIIDTLPERADNQQRELMMVLQRMKPNDEYEGLLFNTCSHIWQQLDKQPSVRFNAFKLMVSIVDKHPSLMHEINTLTDPYYIDTLSDGVKKTIMKLLKDLSKRQS